MQLPPQTRATGPMTTKIFAGKLFDPYTLTLLPNRIITVSRESGLILDVQPYSAADEASVDFSDPQIVDLRPATVLPGFVDAHVHRKPSSSSFPCTRPPLAKCALPRFAAQCSCIRTPKRHGKIRSPGRVWSSALYVRPFMRGGR
ncbi:hypothetical protein AcW2_000041 [Taiwanofungus camphoratus]|nr:hypothetical protein AcW2_000041 [Antrodia cinnamomea]